MKDFSIPSKQPPPADQPGQPPAGLPPRHKIKSEPPKLETGEIESDTVRKVESLTDAEFDELIKEEVPVIPDKPPQCDWHLNAMMSGDYPDPFTLPAAHIARQSIAQDVAGFLQAVAKNSKEEAADNDSNDTTNK